ncbi:reticulocyte binding protein 2b [Plasmodium ovale curtisi]|uniref:Reticulocyte binding protein 2b n=1 Tax=Plasmodium ovale curtisi TaxID=864141 RepID=A0A1A8XAZ0_PLAOA|nr:reticulocyte binding protein 2b [Plasmodium ovale curtisi]
MSNDSSYSNEREHINKSNNTMSHYDDQKKNLSNNKSFVSLQDAKSTRKLPHHSYIRENSLYVYKRDNNKWEDQNDHMNTVASAFIQKGNTSSLTQKTIDYIEVTADNGYIISPTQPHYAYKYYFTLIKNYITYEKYAYEKYEALYNSEVVPLFNRIHTDHSACNEEKTNMINLLNKLMDPEKHNTNLNQYISQHEEYRAKIDRFEDCLEKNHKNYMYSIEKIDKEMLNFLQLLRCTTDCDTVTYDVIVELNMENIQQIPYDWYYNFIYSFKAPFSSGVDMMENIENELGKSVTIETIKFLQKEIIYIIERFDEHLEKYYSAVDKIIEYSKEKVPDRVIKSDLIESYINLAYFQSNIKFSGDKLKLFEEEIKSKLIVLLNIFRKIAKELEEKVNLLFNSQYSLPNSDSVVSDSEAVLKLGETLYKDNSNLIEDLAQHNDYEISNVKTIYEEQMSELNDALGKVKELIASIKTIHKANESAKKEVENKMKQKSDENHSQERVSELLEIVGILKSYTDTAQDNLKKIEQNHKESKDLKIKIEKLISSVKKLRENLERLIEIKKHNGSVMKEINGQMEYIIKNTDSIKKIIYIKKEIDKNIVQTDEFTSVTPFNMVQFTKKMNQICHRVRSIITNFYVGDLEKLVNNVSVLELKHKKLISKKCTKDEMDNFLRETKEKYTKIANIKCTNIPGILTNLQTELENLLKIKDNIIGEVFQKINTEISKSIDALQKEYNHLTDNMRNYKEEKKILEEYKDNLASRKDKFLDTLHENDDEISERKNSYIEFLKHRDSILNRGSIIFREIITLKENLGHFRNTLLPLYSRANKKLELQNRKIYPQIDTLVHNFNDENLHIEVGNCEKEFKRDDVIINNLINDIENSNNNINAIKTLNASVKIYKTNKKSLEKLKKNKDDLIEKVNKHLEEVKANKLIDSNEKTKFEDALNKELDNINIELVDTTMEKLKTQIEDILKYCTSSKENIMKHEGTQFEVLEKKKLDWSNIEGGITKLNARYQVINKTIEDLVNDQQREITNLMNDLITDKENEIYANIRKHIIALGQMKIILNSFDFKKKIKSDKNDLIQGKIRSLRGKIESTLRKINEKSCKLNGIKEGLDEHISKEGQKKRKSLQFSEEKHNMEKLYDIIQNTFKEINSVEETESILVSVKNTELEYEKLLIYDTMEQINDEKEKAKVLMADIDLSVESIEEFSRNLLDESKMNTTDFNYKKYYNEGKVNSIKIYQTVQDIKAQSEKTENIKKLDELKNIKEYINASMEDVVKEYNAMQEALTEINNVKKILVSNNSKKIINDIVKNAINAKFYITQAINEIKKSDSLIKEIEGELAKSREYNSKILASTDNEEITVHVNKIKRFKEEFTKKKREINTRLNIAEEYKTKTSLETHNVNRGKIKADILQKKKGNDESSLSDIDIGKVNKYTIQCAEYSKDIVHIEQKSKEYKNLLIKYEADISTILKESKILEMKTKSEKRKNDVAEIFFNVEKKHSEIHNELKLSLAKLKKMSNEPNDGDMEDNFYNTKSRVSDVSIQYNLERMKNIISAINNIEQDIDKIFSTANDSMNSIQKIHYITKENPLGEVENKESKYNEHLSNINKQNQLIQEKRNKVDEINSTIEDISNKLEKHKQNYEIEILGKINEIADEKKAYINQTKDELAETMKTFISLFNGLDLKEYNFGKYIEDYKSRINEIYSEFKALHKLIGNKMEEVSRKRVDYSKAKKLREEAKEEITKLKNKEDEAKKYLLDVKKKESFRLIYHLKERIRKLNEACKEEYSKTCQDHTEIKRIIQNIKNLGSESSSSEKLKDAVNKNNDVQNTSYYSFKNEAQNILDHIVKSANFLGIKVVAELLPSRLNAESRIKETVELNFESQVNVKLETQHVSENKKEMEVYSNMLDAYQNFIQILKYADGINKIQTESESLVKEGNRVINKTESINELKEKLESTKNKKNLVSSKIDDTINKFSHLKNIKCDNVNCDDILEKSKCIKLRELATTFNQKKHTLDESKLKKIKINFDDYLKSLGKLEIEIKNLQENDIIKERIHNIIFGIDQIEQNIKVVENDIAQINASIDEVLKNGYEWEAFRYISIKDKLKTKIDSVLININAIKEKAQEHLEYVKNNYSYVVKEVGTLNKQFGIKSISDYALTNVQEANENSTELTTTIKETERIINSIHKEFIEVNEEVEISTLKNSSEKLKYLYSELNTKKNTINDIYKKIRLTILKEIKATSDKYNDIIKVFNNVVENQKERLIANHYHVEDFKKEIKSKENELIQTDRTFTLELTKNVHDIYDIIKMNIHKLQRLNEESNREDKKLRVYSEIITHLINRNKNTLNDINEFEKKEKVKNENVQIVNEENSNIEKTKRVIKNLEGELKKLLERIKENEYLIKDNSDVNFISEVIKNVDNIKGKILKRSSGRTKLFQIENNFNDINNIFSEIKTDYDISKFIDEISKKIDVEVRTVKDQKNKDIIIEAKKNITNYNEKIKSKLSKFKSVLEKIKEKKKDMDNLYIILSPNNDIDIFNSAKKFVDNTDDITEKLYTNINKLADFKNNIDDQIKQLADKLNEILNISVIDNLSDYQQILLTKYEEKTQEKTNDTEHTKYKKENRSQSKSTNEKYRLAGGIIIAFTICSGIALAIFNNKDEKEEDINTFHEGYEGIENPNLQDKEEIIEICFDESYDNS